MSPAASSSTNVTSPGVIVSTRFVHQQRTRNNAPLPSILEKEDEEEATPPDVGVQHDIPAGGAEHRQDDVTDPIRHYVEDIQGVLRTRTGTHPVEPVRKKPVWRAKTTGRDV